MLVELSLGSCNSILLAGGLSAALQLQGLFPGGPNFGAWSRLGSSTVGSHPFQSSKASSQNACGATHGSATAVVLCSIWRDARTPGPYSELPARMLPSHHPTTHTNWCVPRSITHLVPSHQAGWGLSKLQHFKAAWPRAPSRCCCCRMVLQAWGRGHLQLAGPAAPTATRLCCPMARFS